jgi:hypothetical protein
VVSIVQETEYLPIHFEFANGFTLKNVGASVTNQVIIDGEGHTQRYL